MKLKFDTPAESRDEAILLGNGHMGVTVTGGADRLDLMFYENFAGIPGSRGQPAQESGQAFRQTREHCQNGSREDAAHAAPAFFVPSCRFKQNIPPFSVQLTAKRKLPPINFYRELTLENAIMLQHYGDGDTIFFTECFASHPERVFFAKITKHGKAPLDFSIFIKQNMPLIIKEEDGGLLLTPQKTDGAPPADFAAFIKAEARSLSLGKQIKLRGGDEALVCVCIATPQDAADPVDFAKSRVEDALEMGWERAKSNHAKDFSALFSRMYVELSEARKNRDHEELFTDELLQAARADCTSAWLTCLMFQYGRYLALCSVRADSALPALTGGVWTQTAEGEPSVRLDGDAETVARLMEVSALGDCNVSLSEFASKRLLPAGRLAAKYCYGGDGFSAEAACDTEGLCFPVSDALSPSPASGAAIALSLYDHFIYTYDIVNLEKTVFPILEESVQFWLAYLFRPDAGAKILGGPSLIRERVEAAAGTTLAVGGAFELAAAKELLAAYIGAAAALKIKTNSTLERVRETLEGLADIPLSKDGCLAPYCSADEKANLLSAADGSLAPLYPFSQIDACDTPLYAAAASRTLEKLCGESNGGGQNPMLALLCYARLENSQKVGELLTEIQKRYTAKNLTLGVKKFSLAANAAFSLSVCEMLVRCSRGEIHILPALPPAFDSGRISGLRTPGGFVIDLEWKKRKLTHLDVKGIRRTCTVRYNGRVFTLHLFDGHAEVNNTD